MALHLLTPNGTWSTNKRIWSSVYCPIADLVFKRKVVVTSEKGFLEMFSLCCMTGARTGKGGVLVGCTGSDTEVLCWEDKLVMGGVSGEEGFPELAGIMPVEASNVCGWFLASGPLCSVPCWWKGSDEEMLPRADDKMSSVIFPPGCVTPPPLDLPAPSAACLISDAILSSDKTDICWLAFWFKWAIFAGYFSLLPSSDLRPLLPYSRVCKCSEEPAARIGFSSVGAVVTLKFWG